MSNCHTTIRGACNTAATIQNDTHQHTVFPTPGGPHTSVISPRLKPPPTSLPARIRSSCGSPVETASPPEVASFLNAAEADTVGSRSSGCQLVGYR